MSKRSLFSFAVIAAALAAAIAPMQSEWVERVFSKGLYPVVETRLVPMSNLVPLALFDVLLVATIGLVIVWLAHALAHFRQQAWRFLVRTATLAATLYLTFLLVWGLNYRREPLRRALPFHPERITADELRRLGARTVADLNALYPRLPNPWPGWRELPAQLHPAFDRARAVVGPSWPVELGRPKRSLLNLFFKRTAVDGMIDPFLLEVLVNQDVLPLERPFIVSHEWGHLAGRADESEASFLGWVACMNGPLWARYSAWLSLYGTIVAGLPPDDQRSLGEQLSMGPRQDLLALAQRIRQQSSATARRMSQAGYDRFLKANRLQEGVASYGLVVTLLLGTDVQIPPLEGS